MKLNTANVRFWVGLALGTLLGLTLPNFESIAQAARTSLSSLQLQIDDIISGAQPVGDSERLGGSHWGDYVQQGDSFVASDLATFGGIMANGDIVTNGVVQVGGSSVAATPATRGMIRFNSANGKLEFSDGTEWNTLQVE